MRTVKTVNHVIILKGNSETLINMKQVENKINYIQSKVWPGMGWESDNVVY